MGSFGGWTFVTAYHVVLDYLFITTRICLILVAVTPTKLSYNTLQLTILPLETKRTLSLKSVLLLLMLQSNLRSKTLLYSNIVCYNVYRSYYYVQIV